jgi:sulfite exporter TauE/SafE
MTALVATVIVASLVGSLHCAGMCGPFAAFALGADPLAGRSGGGEASGRLSLHAAYNGGRLVTYVGLGALAGLLGAAVDLGGEAIGLARAAAVLAGGVMVVFGGAALLRALGLRVPTAPVPGPLRRLAVRANRRALALSPVRRALAVGLLTTLLPCGWLYAFAVTAAGTASPLWGAVTMAAFWVGTLPIMLALGAGVQTLAGAMARRLPVITSLAIVCVGLYTVVARGAVLAPVAPVGPATPTAGAAEGPGHAEASEPESHEAELERVRSLPSTDLPCCADHDG